MTLANRIKERRRAMKLTQTELAKLTGVTQQTIHAIEKGEITRPKRLIELVIALDCGAMWLVHGTQYKEGV